MVLVLALACSLVAHDYFLMQLPPIDLLSALAFHTSPPVEQCPIHTPSTLTMGLDLCAHHSLFGRMDPYYTGIFYLSCGFISALPQHLPSPFSAVVLSSQYLFQRGPIWISWNEQQHILRCTNLKAFMEDIDSCINGFSLFLAVLIYLTSYQRQYNQGIIIHGKSCNIELINQLLNVFDVNTVSYFSVLGS